MIQPARPKPPATLPRGYQHSLKVYEELIVAEVDGSIAGALAYYPPGGPRSFPLAQMIPPAAAYLAVLAVSPRFRRAGVAGAHRRVHRECIEGARRDGADEIWLVTSELMPAARALYEGFGFTRRGETSHYDVRYWSYSLSLGSR